MLNSMVDAVIQSLSEKGIDVKKPGTRYKIKIINARGYNTSSDGTIDKLLCSVTQEEADCYDKYIFVKKFRLNLSSKNN